MRFDDQRIRMVETHLIARNISNKKVIDAFKKVPRELFVSDEWREFAYKDHPLSIGFQQTISQPYIVALMMSLLDIKDTDRVLEIGTGSGYQTALLAEISSEVFTVERIEDLLMNAKKILKKLEYKNIYYKIGDGSLGWENALPIVSEFNKIIVSAASPKVPEKLLNQLSVGGKLILPLGSINNQDLVVYEKQVDSNGNDCISSNNCGQCVFVPLIGKDAWADL
ncbi:MAG: protein-L-isoaspartate(D-aspartate) O-methyltransferase [Bacilli bacterium]|jgi:protein-L-isoaspartate(D-aspartate) O-methyltransferase|nr:protein-L-isoaspartate(D-aspartate) O-methyltransferase [Candidatus Cloacimonadota bacterium]MDD4188301.1 protein-L-isoaspartate(D-aspartate) O-methyltransferase [Bacilli bacterium]